MTASAAEIVAALAAAGPVRERVLAQLVESLVLEGAVEVSGDGGPGTTCGPFALRFVRTASFGRVRLTSISRGGRPVTPGEFLAEAPIHADPACRTRLGTELAATVLGDALALARRPRVPLDPGAGHDVLEALTADGHRYHPAYKSRTGFGVGDLLAYAPEFAPTVRPLLLDAEPGLASVSAAAGLDPAVVWSAPPGRVGIPVHPWQWEHHVAAAHADALASGALRVGGPDLDAYRPQASIRTLACVSTPYRPSVKLPLAITNTSTSRGLAPHTVRNAAPISDWLAGIVAGDPVLVDKARVIVLREVLGVTVEPGLGAIWRESLHVHLHPGERAVPFPGLAARSGDGVPLIDPWIRAQGARGWVERLVVASVLPLVHLLVVHGVALEAHAQNMLLVHAGGLPTRVALKDFHDGVRFSRELLAAPGPALEAPPADHPNANSFLETDDPALVTGFLLDALCFVNLAEIAWILAGEYGLGEEEFWAVVAGAIRAHADRVPGFAGRMGVFDVFAPTLEVEKLTTRRLWPDTELRVHALPNPLRA
ncbi:IucA/IucC family protein [Actinomycetospora sp. CA-101289]|uniref:IucA/IucC family protein n=1 Tax=Actinomycetospora sp. CA-101289 TaxID=3239893 RepID=UPI003D9744EA